MNRRRFLIVAIAIVAGRLCLPAAETLPSHLSDSDFWKLVSDFSETNGYFRSDNLLSNEMGMQTVIPELLRIAKPSRVYMGVGPEQNFTYIAAIKPRMAFIVDIRRGNRDLQLMYKALFELSADRAEFVSRLFSKPRPASLTTKSTANDLFAGYWDVPTSDALYKENQQAIRDVLKKHAFPLTDDDAQGVLNVYYQFYYYGPRINYSSSNGGFGRGNQPTYAELMTSTDAAGENRSYLATEDRFAFLKDLESHNLLVPVVGDFGGPKAIRAVGSYVKEHGGLVSTFYLSNVEQYLLQDGKWRAFCQNVATLPLDETSRFIRSTRGGGYGYGGLMSQLGEMAAEVKNCGE